MSRTEIIYALKNVLRRVAPDAKVILYGSEARHNARADSDIDLLVLLDKENISLSDRQAVTYPLYDVELETGVIISPQVFSKWYWNNKMLGTPFYQNVMKDGIVL
jgi:predicted nucleotidyltransferase